MRVQETLRYGPVEGFRFGYSPFAAINPMPVWCYYLDGLLIDTAQRHMQREVLTTFAQKPIHRIVLTHFHEDHAGNAAALRAQHHCTVLAGELTARLVATTYPLLPYERFWFGAIQPCPDVLPLPTVVETEHYRLKPIPTLGHSDDHHVLLEPRQGWLFAGDFYIGKLKIFRRNEDIYQQIESTRHILTYDFDTVFCGHNPVLNAGRRAVEDKLQYLENLVERVQEANRRGLSVRQIMQQIGLRENWFAKLFTFNDVGADYLIRSVLTHSPTP